ncbi:hypothetical protein DPEC_G00014440 [Dallia pectoralis]|uniref:Uncharacterized protein n=1 Tax=Dallia pectoralis TaxID=75939 RepID=A0ACC2HML0_DALPE|nr:hypothetical protein DPEC_G00014440 [Dallia pectoralis]
MKESQRTVPTPSKHSTGKQMETLLGPGSRNWCWRGTAIKQPFELLPPLHRNTGDYLLQLGIGRYYKTTYCCGFITRLIPSN